MTDHPRRSTPEEEPVIGRDDLDTVFARSGSLPPSAADRRIGEADQYGDYPEEDVYPYSPYRHNEYYADDSPVRQPMFYFFLVLAVIVGGLFVFFLITLVRGNGDGSPTPAANPASLLISVDSPLDGDRVEVGSEVEVRVRARANEEIIRFELYQGSVPVDRVSASSPDTEGIYSATLKVRFDSKGEYGVVARVVSESGAEQDSPEIRLTAVETVSGEAPTVEGQALTLVTLRIGPGDNYASAGQLQPGEKVVIRGKTRDASWLFVDRGGGLWVKAAGIEAFDSLALVNVREPTPTPIPPTPTEEPNPSASASPSVTVSPTAPVDAPDLIPANASLADAGATLNVTVANIATVEFSGALVVSVADIGAGGTLPKVFDVTIPANGAVIVTFEITPPVTEPRVARVTVDPDLAVVESNEDNNTAAFSLEPPVDAPELILAADVLESTIKVTITNVGGPLAPSPITVRVTVGSDTVAKDVGPLALAKDQSAVVEVGQPGSGTATVQVLVNGQPAAEIGDIEIP